MTDPNVHRPLTSLADEEELFREVVRDFAENKIKPHVHAMDEEGKFHAELLKEFFSMNFMGIEIPEEFGGAAGSFFMAILAVEELSRIDASAGVIVDVQNTLVNNALLRWGTDAQKRQYLPRLASSIMGAYALSEPGAGSDAFSLNTRAEPAGDYYYLSGQKLWITNAAEADVFIVFATIDPGLGYRGITSFIIERQFPGFQIGKKENKLGIRASSTCELLLDRCQVPRANVLGEVGKGYKISIETLNEGRIGIAAQMVGLAGGALQQGIHYAKERVQFGKPIASFQAIQFQLAELSIQWEAARLMTYNAARLKDAGFPFLKEAAMAKYFASQMAEKVTSQVIEIFGGYGYSKEYPAEKYFRDSKIGKIYEGTSFMQLQTIAKVILGDR
ncbi:MAG: acyl-CoA dehydrogenase [Terriglobia bacterium]